MDVCDDQRCCTSALCGGGFGLLGVASTVVSSASADCIVGAGSTPWTSSTSFSDSVDASRAWTARSDKTERPPTVRAADGLMLSRERGAEPLEHSTAGSASASARAGSSTPEDSGALVGGGRREVGLVGLEEVDGVKGQRRTLWTSW